jgi:hypothetical protein
VRRTEEVNAGPPRRFGATPLVAKLPRRSALTDAHSAARARETYRRG